MLCNKKTTFIILGYKLSMLWNKKTGFRADFFICFSGIGNCSWNIGSSLKLGLENLIPEI